MNATTPFGRTMKRAAYVVLFNIVAVAVLFVAAEIVLSVVRAGIKVYQGRASYARWHTIFYNEAAAPYMVAENMSWRYIKLFTMRRNLVHGPEYRMDSFGFRTSRDGKISLDNHNVLDCKKVWLFGGSTAMGLGLPADNTLAAQLQRLLNGRGGERFCVFNLGMASAESTQEVLLFYEVLRNGFRPDVVIFYDGINESIYSRDPAKPLSHPVWSLNDYHINRRNSASNWSRWKYAFNIYREASSVYWFAQTVRSKFWPRTAAAAPLEAKERERQADDMIYRYYLNVRLLKGISKELGVKVFFFWQPAMGYDNHYGFRTTTEQEARMWKEKGNPDEFRRRVAFKKLQGVKTFEEFPVFDIADAFSGISKLIYMDPRHPNSFGNSLIAERIYKHLKEQGIR